MKGNLYRKYIVTDRFAKMYYCYHARRGVRRKERKDCKKAWRATEPNMIKEQEKENEV